MLKMQIGSVIKVKCLEHNHVILSARLIFEHAIYINKLRCSKKQCCKHTTFEVGFEFLRYLFMLYRVSL